MNTNLIRQNILDTTYKASWNPFEDNKSSFRNKVSAIILATSIAVWWYFFEHKNNLDFRISNIPTLNKKI